MGLFFLFCADSTPLVSDSWLVSLSTSLTSLVKRVIKPQQHPR